MNIENRVKNDQSSILNFQCCLCGFLFLSQFNRVRSHFPDFFIHFHSIFGKQRAVAGREIVHLDSLATDADGTDTVTYSLSDDAGGLFTIDANTGVITVNGALDYETATSHSVTVLATSSDTSTSSQAFTIDVTDVNEGSEGHAPGGNAGEGSLPA